jgi:hypothetical protein
VPFDERAEQRGLPGARAPINATTGAVADGAEEAGGEFGQFVVTPTQPVGPMSTVTS